MAGIAGFLLIVIALVVLKYGDQVLTETFTDKIQDKLLNKEMISWHRKFMKYIMGIILLAIGIQFLFIQFGLSHSFFGTPV